MKRTIVEEVVIMHQLPSLESVKAVVRDHVLIDFRAWEPGAAMDGFTRLVRFFLENHEELREFWEALTNELTGVPEEGV